MEYRVLTLSDLHSDLLNKFNRYQVTDRVWFQDKGQYILRNDHFVDNWNNEKKKQVIQDLRHCVTSGGSVIGAFKNLDLAGFANVEGELFGSHQEYVELPYIHVSNEFRGSGIGKQLFERCCKEAERIGARKLYIAAHPSVETQHFYRTVGCTFATEVNQQILAKEPLDIQLECIL